MELTQLDFRGTVLDDQKELRDKLGIPEYQRDEIFRFMAFLGDMMIFEMTFRRRTNFEVHVTNEGKIHNLYDLTVGVWLVSGRNKDPKHYHSS